MPRVRIDPVGSISYYRCRGIIEAKVYVPASFRNLKQKGIKLIYKDKEFTVSASSMGRASGFKAYLPRSIVKHLLDTRPNRVLFEAEGGSIRILAFGWECKVCGRFTEEPDKLCWSHRVGEDGQCKRCGKMILQPNRTLCDGCLSMLEKVMSK